MLALCNLTLLLLFFCIVNFQFLRLALVVPVKCRYTFLVFDLFYSDLSFIVIKGYHSASGIRQRGVEHRTTVNQVIHSWSFFVMKWADRQGVCREILLMLSSVFRSLWPFGVLNVPGVWLSGLPGGFNWYHSSPCNTSVSINTLFTKTHLYQDKYCMFPQVFKAKAK